MQGLSDKLYTQKEIEKKKEWNCKEGKKIRYQRQKSLVLSVSISLGTL